MSCKEKAGKKCQWVDLMIFYRKKNGKTGQLAMHVQEPLHLKLRRKRYTNRYYKLASERHQNRKATGRDYFL